MNSTLPDNPGCETLAACPACDGRTHAPLALPGHWIGSEVFDDLRVSGKIGLVRCRGCGLVFTNPRPSLDRLNAYYSGDTYVCHETAGSASGGTKADFVLDRLRDHLPEGGAAPRTLLDYGAGGGAFLLHARARGWTVRGLEPGRRGLETCRGLGLDVAGDVDELPAGMFGLITLHHVLEHLADPARVLHDIRRLLAPGGRLFIEVPNARSLRARLALPILSRRHPVDERYRAFPIHLMYYNEATLRCMLERSGWSVDTAFTIGLGMDEFFTRGEKPNRGDIPVAGNEPLSGSPRRRVKRGLRDAFLGLGLGENLAVVARPHDAPAPPAVGGNAVVTRVGRSGEVVHA